MMSVQSESRLDPTRYRDDFPILSQSSSSGAPLAFLDNAASTQRPIAVLDAMDKCFEEYYANVHRGIHTLSEASTAAYESARVTVQKFLNASSRREIIFTSGTTMAINAVARSWGDQHVSSGDMILLTIADHHANIVPWQQLAERVGCKIEFLPLTDEFTIDDTVVEETIKRLQPKMFAFPATSNVLGTDFPVKTWTAFAHEHGATVLVDAAQAAPHRMINVVDWDSDFVVFSGHKICGPTGIGVLYGKESILESMPAFLGGGAMISSVTTEGFESAELPEKFEAGTPPIAEAIGLAVAIDYVRAIGLDAIHDHEQSLTQRAESGLRAIDGVNIVGPPVSKKSGIVSFSIDGIHAHDIAQWLDSQGIAVRAGHHCAMPLHDALALNATVRASFYFYNTEEEVDRLVDAVKTVKEKFATKGRRRRK